MSRTQRPDPGFDPAAPLLPGRDENSPPGPLESAWQSQPDVGSVRAFGVSRQPDPTSRGVHDQAAPPTPARSCSSGYEAIAFIHVDVKQMHSYTCASGYEANEFVPMRAHARVSKLKGEALDEGQSERHDPPQSEIDRYVALQGYLAHQTPPPLRTPQGPRRGSTAGS